MMLTIAILMSQHAELGDTGDPTGTFAAEVAHAALVFEQAGYDVLFVSPDGGEIPMYGTDYDAATDAFVADESWMARVNSSVPIAQMGSRAVAAVYVAGGHGAMFDLAQPGSHAEWLGAMWDAGKPVAAVCHGPAALVPVTDADGQSIVAGRRVAGFTNSEEVATGLDGDMPFLLADRLTALGATHVPHGDWQSNVVVNGRLVTGQNPASAQGVAQAVVRAVQADVGG